MRVVIIVLAALACQSTANTDPAAMSAASPLLSDVGSTVGTVPDAVATGVVARWTGGQLSAADLEQRVGNDLRHRRIRFMLEQYEAQARALDVLVMESLIEEEVRRRGLDDADALIRFEVEDKIVEPTDAEVAEFWPVIERQFRGATLDEARPVVVAELIRRAQGRRYSEFVEELRQRSDLKIDLPYPNLPKAQVEISPDNPTLGPADAAVTIVQFAEYQCYYCNQVKPAIARLLKEYDGKVRLVWKDYPLSSHGRAIPAAVAAHCAGEQGKYWEMNEVLLANQHAVSDADMSGYAMDLGMKAEPFQACMGSGRYEGMVQNDVRIGKSLDVRSTPTFFVNGVVVSGAQPYARFKALVDRELAGG